MNDSDDPSSLHIGLTRICHALNEDNYMLMEFLTPVVDGCRAAFNVGLNHARESESLSDAVVEEYLGATTESFLDTAICFKSTDTNEMILVTFKDGITKMHEDCVEPTAVISASERTLLRVLDADPKISLTELMNDDLVIGGTTSQDALEALGLLCYPQLLRMAKSGIDPTNLESEDADSIITATASELVTTLVQKWLDIQLGS
ncbi:MAG: hypothetical protein RTU30_05235 [Candidatus Thorarchaeota archaeon]